MIRYYLGLDWGAAKIGMAVADEETRVAFGAGILKNDTSLKEHLSSFVAKYPPQAIILGLPTHKEHASAEARVRAFAELLERQLAVPVRLVPEMFTTRMAQAHLRERGSLDIGADDAEAARILLQEWLDAQVK